MIEVLRRLGYFPRFCVWELTLACDMRCRHCGSFAGKPRERELDTKEALSVASQLADMHCERLTLSGGEPTLRPDWDCIASALTKRNVRTNVITNGWSWSAEHTQRAIDAGLENVAFSLDGPETAHDTVRAKPGSYARVMRAIDHCTRAGLRCSVVTHLNALNARCLREFRQTLHEHEVSSWQVQMGNPAGSMVDHRDLVLDPSELLWIVPEIAAIRSEFPRKPKLFVADNVGYYGRYERALRDRGTAICFWIGCRAGCQVIGIESNGNVKGCLSLPSSRHGLDDFVEGNVRDTTLAALWSRPDAFAFNRKFEVTRLHGFCRTCRFADICRGGCSWSAFCRTGDRFDNPLCFYRVAVEHERWDLIDDGEIDREAHERRGDDGPVPIG